MRKLIRIRRSVEDETGKVDHAGLAYKLAFAPLSEQTATFKGSIGDGPGRLTLKNAGTALAALFTFYHTLRQSQCRRDYHTIAQVCHDKFAYTITAIDQGP